MASKTASIPFAVFASKAPAPDQCTRPPLSTTVSVMVGAVLNAERACQPAHVAIDRERALQDHGIADRLRHSAVRSCLRAGAQDYPTDGGYFVEAEARVGRGLCLEPAGARSGPRL